MKQNNSKLYSILSFLLIAVLILSAVGVVLRYTNGGTTDFALFYVVHDGQSIMTDTTIELNDGETATFAPKYSADDLLTAVGKEPEKKGYNVKIVPNITKETSFTYQAGGNKYRFEKLADTDFSSAFNLKKEEKFFSVKVDDFTVKELLSTQYESKTVTMPEDFDTKKSYFNMIISSYDEKNVIVIGLQNSDFTTFTLDDTKYIVERGTTLKSLSKTKDFPLEIEDRCYYPPYPLCVVSNGRSYPIYSTLKDGWCVRSGSALDLVNGHIYYAVTHLNSVTIASECIPYVSLELPLYMSWQEFVSSDYNFKNSGYRFYILNECIYYKTAFSDSEFTLQLYRGDALVRYDDEIRIDSENGRVGYRLVEVF